MPELRITTIRHGQTEWSQNGRHTSITDLELLLAGREQASALARVLDPGRYVRVLCSPRRRAQQTAVLAGFGDRMEICEDLSEWHYGDYEGLSTPQIRERRPEWNLWRDGCPRGESPEQVSARVQRLIDAALSGGGEVIFFAHGHILRALAARWVEMPVSLGERLVLEPATLSRLGIDHGRRVLLGWNQAAGGNGDAC